MDSNIPISPELVADSDAHLFSAILKSYLRELPVPFLGREDSAIYHKWIEAANMTSTQDRIEEICNIINGFPPEIALNIQYLVKFLFELSSKAEETKMTPHNISICLGPTILWNDRSSLNEQGNIERIIGIVATLIESYNEVFPKDLYWEDYEDSEVEQLFRDSMEVQHKEFDSSFQFRKRMGTGISNRQNKAISYGNFTPTSPLYRTSMADEVIQAPTLNITTAITDTTNTSTLKPVSDSSPSPNQKKKGYGTSFKTKFLSKMQNINSPKAIEEKDADAIEKHSIE